MTITFENLKGREDEIIEENMGLALLIARDVESDPNLVDDAVAEAFMVLTSIVRGLGQRPELVSEIKNPKAYIRASVFRHLRRLQAKASKFVSLSRDVEIDAFGASDTASNEAWELIESICENDSEVAVVDRRKAGRTDREIADELEVTQRSVRRIRQKLRERYDLAC